MTFAKPTQYVMTKFMYDHYKNEPLFVTFLTFGRILNSINYCRNTLVNIKPGNNKPSDIRATQNYFFFMCGILHEGIRELQKNKILFKSFDTYKSKVAIYLKKVANFDKTILGTIRDKAVFHLDNKDFYDSIQTLDLNEYELITSTDKSYGETYYILSDLIALNILFMNMNINKNNELEFLDRLVSDLKTYSDEYVVIVSDIMKEAIDKMGWLSDNVQIVAKN